jgi:Family of unknown function (DUF5832)
MSEPKEYILTADEPVPGQEWCLVSFVSPENVLKNKDLFFFQSFLNQFELTFKTNTLERFFADRVNAINQTLENHAVEFEKQDLSGVAQTCRNAKLKVDETLNSIQEFSKNNLTELNYENVKDKYDTFMYLNKAKLDTDFYNQNKFQTSMRGLKIRGSYASHEEASYYADKLIKKDDSANIYAVKVGKWIPWDPSDSELKNVDTVYQEQELNTLMKKYKENEDARETFYRDMRNRNKTRTIDNMSGPASNTVSGSGDMFSSVGDLALQRKMEASSKQ